MQRVAMMEDARVFKEAGQHSLKGLCQGPCMHSVATREAARVLKEAGKHVAGVVKQDLDIDVCRGCCYLFQIPGRPRFTPTCVGCQ